MIRSLTVLLYFCLCMPNNIYAAIGDEYFCEDLHFNIYENGFLKEIQNFKFFLRWSSDFVEVKFTGDDNWRTEEKIVVQDKVSFLAFKFDDVGNSGWSTLSLNEANKSRIIALRTHQDKDFLSNVISECYKQ